VRTDAIPAPLRPVVKEHRLLGHPSDLAGHRTTHGPLPIPTGPRAEWADHLVQVLEWSGLTGRGGAAFPSARKLALARQDTRGVVVVNAMEGEPASDKDKLLLLTAPHLVLDGAQILAAASGARQVTVCVPVGRNGVAEPVERALQERRQFGFMAVPESLVRPPDRFVAGEESALAAWLDRGRSRPAFRPDKGVPLRIGSGPALVHNAETLAHIALIARDDGFSFRQRGLTEEPGTSLVTLSGAVAQPGVVEVDRGTPLDQIVARSRPTGPIAALLVGGYGGVWVGPGHFSTPYASISLRTIGASAGVGVIVVHGASGCGLAETARVARYMAGQSSGQCGPCVFGLPAIADDLGLLAQGRPNPDLMPRLRRRLEDVNGRGGCRHPDGVVAMLRSALAVFADDVQAHLSASPCPHANEPTRFRFPAGTVG
jgi:NADH:ubiquinone oxidoreductase subunit F (NADH-binding)